MYVRDLFEKHKSEDTILELKEYWESSEFKEHSSEWIDVVFDSFSKKRNIQYSKSTLFIDVDDIFNVYHKVYYGKITYSMSFTPWKEVFSMKICKDSVDKYSELELICAIIFDITFFGDEKQTARQRNLLKKSMKKSKCCELKSFDELCEVLGI